MVNLTCQYFGDDGPCFTRPTYGAPGPLIHLPLHNTKPLTINSGTRPAVRCKLHRTAGMVDVTHRLCQHTSGSDAATCSILASYGYIGA